VLSNARGILRIDLELELDLLRMVRGFVSRHQSLHFSVATSIAEEPQPPLGGVAI
jgi:hypothetical protein